MLRLILIIGLFVGLITPGLAADPVDGKYYAEDKNEQDNVWQLYLEVAENEVSARVFCKACYYYKLHDIDVACGSSKLGTEGEFELWCQNRKLIGNLKENSLWSAGRSGGAEFKTIRNSEMAKFNQFKTETGINKTSAYLTAKKSPPSEIIKKRQQLAANLLARERISNEIVLKHVVGQIWLGTNEQNGDYEVVYKKNGELEIYIPDDVAQQALYESNWQNAAAANAVVWLKGSWKLDDEGKFCTKYRRVDRSLSSDCGHFEYLNDPPFLVFLKDSGERWSVTGSKGKSSIFEQPGFYEQRQKEAAARAKAAAEKKRRALAAASVMLDDLSDKAAAEAKRRALAAAQAKAAAVKKRRALAAAQAKAAAEKIRLAKLAEAEKKRLAEIARRKVEEKRIVDFTKGFDAYERGDYATALHVWKPLANQGFAEAQYFRGLMYENGKGVSKDDKLAVKWYTLAAKQGDVDAQYSLGGMYDFGQGVPEDDKEAMKWYRLAAEQGDTDAQKELEILQRKFAEASAEDLSTSAREFITVNPGTPGMLDIVMHITNTEAALKTKSLSSVKAALASFQAALSKEKGYSAFLAGKKKARQEKLAEKKRLVEAKRKSQLAEAKRRADEKRRRLAAQVSSVKDDLKSYVAFLKVQITQAVITDPKLVRALVPLVRSLEGGLSSNELSVLQGLKKQANATLKKHGLRNSMPKSRK